MSAVSTPYQLQNQLQQQMSQFSFRYFDGSLILFLLLFLSLGLIMIGSSSVSYATEMTGNSLHYLQRQLIFIGIGLGAGIFTFLIPSKLWRDYGWALMLLAICLLVLVLIPGIGREVNGSRRWISIGSIGLQVSEFAKLATVIFVASYIDRNRHLLVEGTKGLVRILLPVVIMVGLLLCEPDLGGAFVLVVTAMSMLFVAGARLRHFLILVTVGSVLLALAVYTSPYRMRRLVAFLDPWADPYNSGFQLTQSLIAIGRGEWFGVGLGNSVQKLLYLPEAHTDFIFAVYAEEFGLLGGLLLLLLFAFFIAKLFGLSRKLLACRMGFSGYAVFGFTVMIALQVFINIGVASGLLPTKGLTLPFISYGGSSVIILMVFFAVVLRMQWEYSRFDGVDPSEEVTVKRATQDKAIQSKGRKKK
ncbi:MAG: putative lipid II flippase FtsW [Cellvibrionaceae bacterium]